MKLWQQFNNWWKNLSPQVHQGVIGGIFALLAAVIAGCFVLCSKTPAPLLTPSPTPSFSPTATVSPVSTPTPEVPQPTKATIYYTSDGRVLIEVLYDPPQLRRDETLSCEASTRENFDESQLLLPQSKIESPKEGHTQGRLLYDPRDQPVWCRLLIIDGQGKSWYGKPIRATKR
jgi:hypothetical protein